MTEQEWLRSNDPDPLWRHLEVPDPPPSMLRQSRLLACAMARLAWHVHDEQGRQIIAAMERYADGRESLEGFSALMGDYWDRVENEVDERLQAAGNCVLGLETALHENYPLRFAVTQGRLALAACQRSDDVWRSGQLPQICETMRDIFGNPFRPVRLDLRWRTSTVIDLARGIYDERAFERLPILADALQDAGCDEEAIIRHCRSDGPHVRGCWVVDLLLGKA